MDERLEQKWREIHETKKDSLAWFDGARYGMFIHWGLYSNPAGIWKGKKMEQCRGQQSISEWLMHAMFIPRQEYRSLVPEFNPVKFDAEQWVDLVKQAGMKYLVITSKHHDGFTLFPSKVSDFTIEATPFKRDIIGELHAACKAACIRFGLYYSHSIDWMDGGDGGYRDFSDSSGSTPGFHAYNDWDPYPRSYAAYIRDKALPQMREVLENYPDLHAIWYDVAYHMPPGYSWQFYKIIHDIQPKTLVSQRVGNGLGDYLVPGDNVIPDGILETDKPWETVGTMNNSWGYKSYDTDWKYPKEVLYWIIDIVSKGGNYMLNVGPKGDGTIPAENYDILKTVGAWLDVNGESVYGTRAWKVNHEGPFNLTMHGTHERRNTGFQAEFSSKDFWFTKKNGSVYAICFAPPENGGYTIRSFGDENVAEVSVLGSDAPVRWKASGEGLEVSVPDGAAGELGTVLKVDLK